MNAEQIDRKRKRPITVTLVGAVAVFAFFFYGFLGIMEIVSADAYTAPVTFPVLAATSYDLPSVQVLGGVYLLVSALAALIIGWGAFRMRRWAWLAFMAWCIFILANQLVRYFAGVPGYPAMALAVFVVLALNQAEVQEAFGIIKPENAESELEPVSVNPLDSN